jgi:hypothetical protein
MHQYVYSPSLGLGLFFSFLTLYTVSKTPWTVDQPVARSLPTHRTTQTQNKRIHRHPWLERDSNPSEDIHALDLAATVIVHVITSFVIFPTSVIFYKTRIQPPAAESGPVLSCRAAIQMGPSDRANRSHWFIDSLHTWHIHMLAQSGQIRLNCTKCYPEIANSTIYSSEWIFSLQDRIDYGALGLQVGLCL